MMFAAGRFGNVVSDDSFLSVACFSFLSNILSICISPLPPLLSRRGRSIIVRSTVTDYSLILMQTSCLHPVLDLLHAHGAREIRNTAYTKSRRLNDAFSKKIFPLCFGIVEREYFYYIYLLSCVVNLILHCRIERNKFFCL